MMQVWLLQRGEERKVGKKHSRSLCCVKKVWQCCQTPWAKVSCQRSLVSPRNGTAWDGCLQQLGPSVNISSFSWRSARHFCKANFFSSSFSSKTKWCLAFKKPYSSLFGVMEGHIHMKYSQSAVYTIKANCQLCICMKALCTLRSINNKNLGTVM